MTEQAIAKLVAEEKAGTFDRYAQVMKKNVREALEAFCQQDEEFAQAVVQGGTFEDCMKAVAKSCGNGISDLEAYRRAVRFYFRGADIRFQMTIDLVGNADREEQEELNGVPGATQRSGCVGERTSGGVSEFSPEAETRDTKPVRTKAVILNLEDFW